MSENKEKSIQQDSNKNAAFKFYIKEKVKSYNQICTPDAVYEEMKELSQADQESLWVLYLNTKNMIIGKDIVALGGISSASVDIKILFRRILLNNAPAFIIVHNHPSGEVEPSKNDINLTNTIKDASKIIDIRLLDHIIVSDDKYFSFNSKGLI
jgi:DNA repair protein RadC